MTQTQTMQLRSVLGEAAEAIYHYLGDVNPDVADLLTRIRAAESTLNAPVKRKSEPALDDYLPHRWPDGSRCMARVDYEDCLAWQAGSDPEKAKRGRTLAARIIKSAKAAYEWVQAHPNGPGLVSRGTVSYIDPVTGGWRDTPAEEPSNVIPLRRLA